MLTLSTSTFVKFLNKTSPQKVQELTRLLTNDGYPYYGPLRKAARGITINGDNIETHLSVVRELPESSRREHNLAAIKALNSSIRKYEPESFFVAPRSAISTPAGNLTVKLAPDFGMVLNGKRHLVTCWFSVASSPSKLAAKQHNRLIGRNLCVDEFADCEPCLLDLRKKEAMSVQGEPTAMDLTLAGDFAFIDGYFSAMTEGGQPPFKRSA